MAVWRQLVAKMVKKQSLKIDLKLNESDLADLDKLVAGFVFTAKLDTD